MRAQRAAVGAVRRAGMERDWVLERAMVGAESNGETAQRNPKMGAGDERAEAGCRPMRA
jgi:hypothetical protein